MTYTIGLPSETMRDTTRTVNVSAGGISFIIPRMVSPQTVCQISIMLPDGLRPLAFLGRVAWCARGSGRHRDEFSVGVAFAPSNSREDDQTYAALHRYLASHLVTKYLG